jgi:hypothetical protein
MADALTPMMQQYQRRFLRIVFRSCVNMRLFLLLPLLSGFVVAAADESPSPPVDRKVMLRVSLDTSQREFQIGEIIPIKLSFSSRLKDHYQLNMATYDRSGRMNYEQFHVTPAKGAVDPIPPDALDIIGGGMTNFEYLKPKPWSIRLNLNEWVRLTEPGEYKLTVSSGRVEVKDKSSPYETSPVTARSNEITLKILPADREWQKRVCEQAVATINKSPSEEIRVEGEPPSPAEIAWDTLRYLGTAEAASELAKRLRGEGSGHQDFICFIGLVSSPERVAACDALKKELADPDHPINATFLDTLRMVESAHHPTDPYAAEEQKKLEEGLKKVVEELIAVLPAKRGQALAVSLDAAVNQAWRAKKFPQEKVDKLVEQLIAIFDQLPTHEQDTLLRDRWDKIAGPALLPIVRRYAQVSPDVLKGQDADDVWSGPDLVANAIKRWFELDPVGARAFIIKKITEPAPRFAPGVLDILPDKTLGEVDSPLAQNLAAHDGDDDDFRVASNIAWLIARYATPAILPQVSKELDIHLGKWACDIQTQILAYVLRVDPQAARPRIERALAARGGNLTACYRRLLQEVAAVPVRSSAGRDRNSRTGRSQSGRSDGCGNDARQVRVKYGGISVITAICKVESTLGGARI